MSSGMSISWVAPHWGHVSVERSTLPSVGQRHGSGKSWRHPFERIHLFSRALFSAKLSSAWPCTVQSSTFTCRHRLARPRTLGSQPRNGGSPASTAGGRRTGDQIPGYDIQEMYDVYLLLLRDGTVYTGRCSDLRRRFREHQYGKVASTRSKRPLKLMYDEAYLAKDDAIERERYLKTGDGRQEVRKQLKHTLLGPIV